MYKNRYRTHHDASRKLKDRFVDVIDKKEYLLELLNSSSLTRRAVYLHVPFCNKICSFCPMHKPDSTMRKEYHKLLINQIKELSKFKYMQNPIDCINFGGGTPTAISPEQMNEVLLALHDNFDICNDAEISLESSISELNNEMLGVLNDNKVNRLSIGAQTFNDEGRKLFNRRGDSEKAILELQKIVKVIENTSVDLIYNYPNQTLETLQQDLDVIKYLNLAGISFYSLMIHEQTPIAKILTPKHIAEMADLTREYEFYNRIISDLASVGYSPMENTKVIRNNIDRYDYIRIRHAGGSCIAIGNGAGGNLDRYVYRNPVAGSIISKDIPISSMGRVMKNEYSILRNLVSSLQEFQVDLAYYSILLGKDLNTILASELSRMVEERLIIYENNIITITRLGMFWGNNIIDEIITKLIEDFVL